MCECVCMLACLNFCIETAVVLPDEQRVPQNSDPPATESLSNGSDWNGSSGHPANGNNTSDSLSQDDDLGKCLWKVQNSFHFSIR